MMKSSVLIALLASSSLLAACSTSGIDRGPPPTKSYIADTYTGYDPEGGINQSRLDANGTSIPIGTLTYMESKMLDSTDDHCGQVAKNVVGHATYVVKNGIRYYVLGGLGTAIGAVTGFSGTDFLSYFKYGGGANAGSSFAGVEMTWDESIGVVRSYCMISWVAKNPADKGDGRLKNVMIYPVIAGNGRRLPHTADDGKKFERHDGRQAEEQAETTVPPPPVH